MKKIALKWIISLMSFAIVGLIAFQLYWVDTVIKANDERFKKDVMEALNQVASKLEKQELLLFTYDNFSTNLMWKTPNVVSTGDGNIELFETTFEKKTIDPKMQIDSQNWDMKYDFQVLVEATNEMKERTHFETVTIDNSDNGYEIKIERKLDSLKQANERLKNNFAKVTRKSEMVQMVIHELITNDRSLKSRFDSKQLDSLLYAELRNKGIDLGYEYAVIDDSDNSFIHTVSHGLEESNHYDLYETDLKASLFPNDIMGETAFLAITFPNKNSYLLKKVGSTLASSLVLVLIIMFCFVYSIQTILRQKRLSEIKNDFINNMTHEFKTPIATVSLACEALQDKDISSTETMRSRYLSIISDENKRLGGQVEKVLQMAILDRNNLKLKKEELNLHQVINNAIDKINVQVEEKGGVIEAEFNAENDMVRGDQLHLTNIISNLLDNANKYSPESPEIKIQTSSNTLGLLIKVKDKGIGMTKDAIRNIFNKFYRVPTGNLHDVKGFGLGLAYVKNMIDAHGGTISVTSEPKKGSEFTIFLPYSHE